MKKNKLLIFASGKGSNFKAIVEAINKKEIDAEIVGLICDKDCGALHIAKENDIVSVVIKPKNFASRDLYNTALIQAVNSFLPDYIILAGFMKIIPSSLIDLYPLKILNIHPSLLPSFKGTSAIRQAWLSRVKITGVSVHYVNDKLDQGVILDQEAVLMDADINVTEEKTHNIEHKMYVRTLKKLIEKPYEVLIVSSCLIGKNCRYNGKNKLSSRVNTYIKSFKGKIIDVCPELIAGFSVPRPPINITPNGLFIDNKEITNKLLEASNKIIKDIPETTNVLALLKEKSPSCGVVAPLGIFTNELRKKYRDNILIISDEDI